jgi:hypothetical protein
LQLFIEIFNFIQSISPKWASEESESGNEYIESRVEELLSYKLVIDFIVKLVFLFLFQLLEVESSNSYKCYICFKVIFFINCCRKLIFKFFFFYRHVKLEFTQLKLLVLKLFNFEEITWTTNQIPSLINNILYFMPLNKDYRLFLYEKIFLFFNDLRKHLFNKSTTTTTTTTEFVHPSTSLLSSTTINFTQKSDYIDSEILSIMHMLHSIKTERAVARDLVKLLKVRVKKQCFAILSFIKLSNIDHLKNHNFFFQNHLKRFESSFNQFDEI